MNSAQKNYFRNALIRIIMEILRREVCTELALSSSKDEIEGLRFKMTSMKAMRVSRGSQPVISHPQ
jgi:hypothetical protein